jgi:hypothetical protein
MIKFVIPADKVQKSPALPVRCGHVNWWMLALSAIAAVSATAVLVWQWIDRPLLGWSVRERSRHWPAADDAGPLRTADDLHAAHEVTVSVGVVGQSTAYGVELRFVDCSLRSAPHGVEGFDLSAGSEPVELRVAVPEGAQPALLEVVWTQVRPRRKMGLRVDLRDLSSRDWHWKWSWKSLRLAGWRLQRTGGRWVEHRGPRRPGIPHTGSPPTEPSAEAG